MTDEYDFALVSRKIKEIRQSMAYLFLLKSRLYARIYGKRAYRADPDKFKKRAEEYRKAHPEKKAKARRIRYRENYTHYHAKAAEYSRTRRMTGKAQAYREKNRTMQRKWARNRSAECEDAYAREQLAKYSPLSSKDFPQSLVELKKLTIKIKREIKSK